MKRLRQGVRRSVPRRRRAFLITSALVAAVAALAVVAVVAVVAVAHLSASSADDASPVDLATPVVMADGVAHRSAVVISGDARIEVLGPTLLRLEYSPSREFEDRPTVNAVDRRMPVPRYSAHVFGGWLTVRTSGATLRYKVGSGPFTAANTSVRFADAGAEVTAQPTWDWECPFDQACQAGAAALSGGAALNWSQGGYLSSAGYVGSFDRRGAAATWNVLGVPAGEAALSIRYANVSGPGVAPEQHRLDLVVDGRLVTTLSVAPTEGAQPWSTLATTVPLRAGDDSVELACGTPSGCSVDVDSLALGPPNVPAPVTVDVGPLGGWIRGFDTFTYGSVPTCAPGTGGDTCQNAMEPVHSDGLLDRAGWRLLDDTQSAIWTTRGWVTPRPRRGDIEDGYLFVYGQDYAGALHSLAQLTGPAPLLPRNVFGVWYSDYVPYSSADIEDSVYPQFRRNDVPLDTLSLDTDWKAPNNWDGWEWNPALFPHPSAFLQWARARGIDVTLNIHSSISPNDSKLPAAEAIAPLRSAGCQIGICNVWDWSSAPQAESNFSLQQSFQQQGVAFWWLDWCCDPSGVTMAGLTPDAWIGHLYAQDMVNRGQRGFVLARIGSTLYTSQEVFPAGPWSDHTSAIAFTGDAWGTWDTLAQEVALTPDEATIGEPYVSDDIGSYLGPPPQGTQDPADLYDRWVQFGTFQPILRLHSNAENRLPWQYPQPVRSIAEAFLRLREALVPYTYTLAAQAHDAGMPIAQPLYLDYPGLAAAYAHPEEYLYGSDMVVAPVTSPGAVVTTSVWIPPGRWVDYFTGATFDGPMTTTVSVPLSRMPVFVRGGGVIPEAAASSPASTGTGPMDLDVFAGSGGSFSLYADAGTGLGYTHGDFTRTLITDSSEPAAEPGATTTFRVTIGPARGHYPGEPTVVGYHLEIVDLTRPSEITLNGHRLGPPAGSGAMGWAYQAATDTVVVDLPRLSTARAITVVVSGAGTVDRPEPPTAS